MQKMMNKINNLNKKIDNKEREQNTSVPPPPSAQHQVLDSGADDDIINDVGEERSKPRRAESLEISKYNN